MSRLSSVVYEAHDPRRARHVTGAAVLSIALVLSGCAGLGDASLPPLAERAAAVDAQISRSLLRDASQLAPPWLPPQRIDLSKPLDADMLGLIAVVANPDLRALRQQAGVADAQVFAAGLLPDPTISLGVDFVIGGPATTLGNALAGALGQDLTGLRTRGATLSQAQARARQVRLDIAWAEWQTAAQARLLASQIASQERQIGLLRDIERTARDLFDRTGRAAGRGDIAGDQLQAARLAEIDSIAQLRSTEVTLAQAQSDLLRLLGLPPQTVLDLVPTSYQPLDTDCAALADGASERTDVAALREGYAAQGSALRAATLAAFPLPGLSVNASRNEGGNRFLGPALNLTLPLWNRNRGGIAVERATAGVLRAEYEARLFQARADIATLCMLLGIGDRQLADARAQLPDIERFAAATTRAARRGDLARSISDNARLAAWSKQLLAEQVEQANRERTIGLEIAAGRKLESWGQGK